MHICHLIIQKQLQLFEYFQLYNERVALEEPGVKNYPKNKFYDDNNITGSCFRGTYGYIITPKGAKEVLDFIKTKGAFPSDRCLCSKATHLQRSNSTYVRLNPFFKETLIFSYSFICPISSQYS